MKLVMLFSAFAVMSVHAAINETGGARIELGTAPTGSLPAKLYQAFIELQKKDPTAVRSAGEGSLGIINKNGYGIDCIEISERNPRYRCVMRVEVTPEP